MDYSCTTCKIILHFVVNAFLIDSVTVSVLIVTYDYNQLNCVITEKTKQILFQRAKASFEAIDHSVVVDKIPCDSKPSKQMQLTLDGQLCKPDVSFEVCTFKN